MEALKKGWTPNLAPLKKPIPAPPPPAVQTLVPPPLVPPPAPVQPPPPPPRAPEPPPIRAPEPPTELRLDRGPSPIQTYASDFSQKVRQTQASTATVLAAEQDAASGEPRIIVREHSRGGVLSVIAGIILLLLGGAGGYFAYTRYLVKVQPVILAPTVSALIFVDEKERITGETPAALLQAISQSMTRSLAPNAVRLLYTDFATTTGDSVFLALRFPAPGVLLRNVNPAQSMAGIVSAPNGVQSPFFILSVASYSDTFAGMLSWEPKMPSNLAGLFPPYPPSAVPIVSTSSPQATTSAALVPTPVFTVFFHDEIVNNHDVRIYRDAEGRSILMYGYWNQTTLVLARDPAAFAEILQRLATSRQQ